jgi:hypothetical protein
MGIDGLVETCYKHYRSINAYVLMYNRIMQTRVI